MRISVQGLGVHFRQSVEALRGVSFEVRSGEFVAIVGPSGCGKSTALNAIASLISPEEAEVTGKILADGVDTRGRAGWDGSLGYVFQRDTLFPWRTVLQNVEAGLEIHGMKKAERRCHAQELIDLVGLKGFEDYFPHQISGGMRQRTSLIRTLAYDPQVILMDEPFGALDAQTRMILQAELIRIWSAQRKTILFVTHDLFEAITLAERVILFSKRPGTVDRICEVPFPNPRDPFELHGSREFAEFHAALWRTVSEQFRGDAHEVQGSP
jgi:NitT/TauT family transport system ATP-binding protein